MSVAFPFHVKTMSGDIITISFDPELGISSIHKEIANIMNCRPDQIHIFPLINKENTDLTEEKSWIPSQDEIVGVLVKELAIEIENICNGVFGTMWAHKRYKQYTFRVKVFDKIYSKSFFYSSETDRCHPTSAFTVLTPPNKRFLPGLQEKSDKYYHTFHDFVKLMKVPDFLVETVSEMIEDRWKIIKFEK